jgi:hypothetical protein
MFNIFTVSCATGWAKQSPLAMVQIVVLFNVDVVLGLINELWDYGACRQHPVANEKSFNLCQITQT